MVLRLEKEKERREEGRTVVPPPTHWLVAEAGQRVGGTTPIRLGDSLVVDSLRVTPSCCSLNDLQAVSQIECRMGRKEKEQVRRRDTSIV